MQNRFKSKTEQNGAERSKLQQCICKHNNYHCEHKTKIIRQYCSCLLSNTERVHNLSLCDMRPWWQRQHIHTLANHWKLCIRYHFREFSFPYKTMKCICNRDRNEHCKPPYIGHRALDDLILCLALDVCSQLFLKYLHLKLKIENGCSSEF